MKICNIYFSPTGNTHRVCEILAKELGGEIREIDLSLIDTQDYDDIAKEELCIIAVPSFGGRVPAVALERLSHIKAQGSSAVLIVSYGNRDYDDTLQELKEQTAQCGFVPIAAIAAVTEHSIMHEYAQGRPCADDCTILRGYAQKINAKLCSEQAASDFTVKGNKPYKAYNGVPLKPCADKACNGCGICAQRCPVGAIPIAAPNTTDKDKCISCMRCIAVCPQHARKLNPVVLYAATQKLKKACAVRKQNELYL